MEAKFITSQSSKSVNKSLTPAHSLRISEASFLDLFKEHDSGERNRTVALRNFLRVFSISCDQVLAHEGVELAVSRRVVDGKRFLVLEGSESLAPLSQYGFVADPDLPRLGVKLVAQTERKDFVAFIEEEMCIVVGLRNCVVGVEKGGEGPCGTNFVVWHTARMA